jgi:hypothetical protein
LFHGRSNAIEALEQLLLFALVCHGCKMITMLCLLFYGFSASPFVRFRLLVRVVTTPQRTSYCYALNIGH